jgi:hypothetical protein
MKVALWAEIRRLAEIEKLSGRAISRRLHCSRNTAAAALRLDQPPARQVVRRASLLDPYKAQINALVENCPELSTVRIREEIARGPDGYTGSTILVRRYLRTIRPARERIDHQWMLEVLQGKRPLDSIRQLAANKGFDKLVMNLRNGNLKHINK